MKISEILQTGSCMGEIMHSREIYILTEYMAQEPWQLAKILWTI
jgi:hypothetical protein